MKIENVPQDSGKLDDQKELCYAIKENGTYVTVQSEGWETKNIVLDQAWGFIREQVEKAKRKVIQKEQSPLAYYMALNQMDIKLLSVYSGYSKRTVKKHLLPDVYVNLPQKIILRYARIFRITENELTNDQFVK